MQRDTRSVADRRSEQGFSAANIAKPLALEFKLNAAITSQEALLDNYVRGFQALQNIAQSIPQPKQPQSSMAALSKDRVEDFARAVPIEKKLSPSTVRPVPTRGACMLFGEASLAERRPFANEAAAPNESKQRIVLVPSVMELDKALELSLDPSPKLSMLAARLRADEIAMREAKPLGVELEFRYAFKQYFSVLDVTHSLCVGLHLLSGFDVTQLLCIGVGLFVCMSLCILYHSAS